jgi:hypothetical protein
MLGVMFPVSTISFKRGKAGKRCGLVDLHSTNAWGKI